MHPESIHFESLYPAESRYKEIEKALGYIKQGNSCQLIALPGVGRSTLLGLLSYNKMVRTKHLGADEARFHFVLTNFSEVKRRPLLDITKFLFLSLVDSLRDRNLEEEYQKTKKLFQEALGMQDELVLFQGLKNAVDILTIEKQMTIVFLFDKFEEYIPMVTPEFFSNLRVLRNRAKYQFATIFSLNRPLEESIEPALFTEFYDFIAGHHVYLPVHDAAGEKFRINYLESLSDKKIATKTLKEVKDLSGNFSREVKVCLQVILADAASSPSPQSSPLKGEEATQIPFHEWDMDTLAHFLLSHKPVQRPLFELWQALTPSEQDFLLAGNYAESDVDYPYLAAVGLLSEGKVAIPLFERFVREILLKEQTKATQKTPIMYDIEKNEIKKGATVLSDSLTASEFKLLLFLLQRPEQVIERETLISSVWNDAVSTAGVTDQAVDQLIFRVRKKIEEDPNSPIHLQTIKGRGYKFTP
jgi:DNA-binding winged helix-turn-helix (wHTH) protein